LKEIEFWFSIGSTYTYLSVTHLKEVEQKFEVKFFWQPFRVRKIMLEMDNIPFPSTKKVKADYMWRDIKRRACRYGFECGRFFTYTALPESCAQAGTSGNSGIHSNLNKINCLA